MRHVIDGRVGHEVVHGVAARCGRVVEGLVEELVRALHGGQEVQTEWRSGLCVAIDDVLHEVVAAGETSSWMPRMAALSFCTKTSP